MKTNGEINKRFGVYRSGCCSAEIVITEGSKFPECPNHPELKTEWKGLADEPIPHANELPTSKYYRKKQHGGSSAA